MSEDTRWAIIQRLDAALVQMHGCSRYTPEDIDELESAAWDALPLLKEQEPKKVRFVRYLTRVKKGNCPSCEMEIESVKHGKITKFCKFCGQAVKWE